MTLRKEIRKLIQHYNEYVTEDEFEDAVCSLIKERLEKMQRFMIHIDYHNIRLAEDLDNFIKELE